MHSPSEAKGLALELAPRDVSWAVIATDGITQPLIHAGQPDWPTIASQSPDQRGAGDAAEGRRTAGGRQSSSERRQRTVEGIGSCQSQSTSIQNPGSTIEEIRPPLRRSVR